MAGRASLLFGGRSHCCFYRCVVVVVLLLPPAKSSRQHPPVGRWAALEMDYPAQSPESKYTGSESVPFTNIRLPTTVLRARHLLPTVPMFVHQHYYTSETLLLVVSLHHRAAVDDEIRWSNVN